MNFARNIKYLREKNDYSQEALGKKLNKTQSTIYLWEKGTRVPPVKVATAVADLFHVSLNDLMNKDITKQDTRVEDMEFDQDALDIIQMLGNHPDLKILFKKVEKSTEEDKEKVANVLKALLPTDGDE